METAARRTETSGKRKWRFRRGYAPWAVAAFIGAAVPFLLYFMYVSIPGVRPWIDHGQDGWIDPEVLSDGRVKLPVFGFPLAGAYLFFPFWTVLVYFVAGTFLSFRKNLSHETETVTMPAHMTPAITSLLVTVPLLSAALALNLKAARFPDFPWEIFGEGEGPAETLFVFRKVAALSLFFPQLSAALSVMSLIIEPSRSAVIVGSIALAAFLGLALVVNALGG